MKTNAFQETPRKGGLINKENIIDSEGENLGYIFSVHQVKHLKPDLRCSLKEEDDGKVFQGLKYLRIESVKS